MRVISGGEDRRLRPKMCKRPGGPRRRRERGAHAQPKRAKGTGDIGEQALLAAPQMRRASDVNQHTIGRVERAPRPPALRPQGELLQRRKIARRVGRDSGQLRAQRARVGEQHSGPRARYQPGIIGRSNARPMRGVGDQRGRRGFGISARSTGSLRRERAPPAIDRQSGEPDGQYPA